MPCRLVPALLDVVVEVLQLSDTSAYYRELSDEEEAAVGAVVAASKDTGRSRSSTWSLPAELQQLGEAMGGSVGVYKHCPFCWPTGQGTAARWGRLGHNGTDTVCSWGHLKAACRAAAGSLVRQLVSGTGRDSSGTSKNKAVRMP